MAANLELGIKVQAVDEVGRWADGRIVRREANSVEVKFTGWSTAFNRTFVFPSTEVREPLPPIEELERSKSMIVFIRIHEFYNSLSYRRTFRCMRCVHVSLFL